MRVLVFDPFHGAAGDMVTGALLHCGADRELVARAMRAVVAEPGITTVIRAGIQAIKVETRAPATHRSYDDVMKKVDAAARDVPPAALAMAGRVFSRIRDAETEVHGDHAHFHEVGADDSIADVIGACTALCSLAVDGITILPVALGSGTATGSHGIFPIPAPATVIILRDAGLSTFPGTGGGELCTPTGAALLAEFSTLGSPRDTPAKILATGYGAGTRNPEEVPNVLRVMLMETDSIAPLSNDCVDVLETNIDDMTGEVIGNALAAFMKGGARDASAIPTLMKKGRPGFLVRVISSPDSSPAMAEMMARELGTLGIRCTPAVHRFVAERTIEEIDVAIAGKKKRVPVKVGKIHGEIYLIKAEFDRARTFAQELEIPVRDVIAAIEKAARERLVNKTG